MTSDDLAKQLHDRETRGQMLPPEERADLDDWYAREDAAESMALGHRAAERTSEALQAEVDGALTQLATVVMRIQEVSSENESLRREIAALHRQLPQLLSGQPA